MPRSKKRKTTHHHHHSSGTNGELSHAEIWDDSALLRSWNDALAEYEYYHSIHARGEDVEEVLRQAEEAEEAESAARRRAITNHSSERHDGQHLDGSNDEDDDVEDGEVEEDQRPHYDGDQDQDQTQGSAIYPDRSDAIPNTQNNDSNTTSSLPVTCPPANKIPALNHHQKTTATNLTSTHMPLSANGDSTGQTAVSDSMGSNNNNNNIDQTLENIKMAYYWAGYYSGLHDGQKGAQSQPST